MATFEEQMKQLEETVERLERGELPLEDSLALFEKGIALSQDCRKNLDAAEGRVQLLLEQRDGTRKAVDFDLEND